MQQIDSHHLDLVFGALADPTRRAILARLSDGEATVNELVEPFKLAQPTITKHIKVLEGAGLVSRGREAQFRPVRLNATPLKEASMWIGNYKRCWEESLEHLDAYVKELIEKGE
ncbi:ArsR/SmtB family transcription factor [Rhizobium sp. LjRoot254]|uniref:ArsR/SmtB family transcription factor n=1 Tax=Rhizobium sp. LjRoot254 TaxID=3342297 RepID=UPI003ED15EDF